MKHATFHEAVLHILGEEGLKYPYIVAPAQFDWLDQQPQSGTEVALRGVGVHMIADLTEAEFDQFDDCIANELGDECYVVLGGVPGLSEPVQGAVVLFDDTAGETSIYSCTKVRVFG